MAQELIYDVGVNDGTDTAFYLRQGHRVVGIEASPVMVAQLREKFAREIAAGAFTLLNVGVANSDGELDFWVSEKHEWSSFHRHIASRNGTPHQRVSVKTRLFSNIIGEHGLPFYCKIDIEGNDSLCLKGLTPETAPRYISIEMSHRDGDKDLDLLRGLGYQRFKIISQITRAQPVRPLTTLGYKLRGFPRRALRKAIRMTLGVPSLAGWRFPHNSSGAFGEDTPGTWKPFEATLNEFRFLQDLDRRHGGEGLGEWFDIHATRA